MSLGGHKFMSLGGSFHLSRLVIAAAGRAITAAVLVVATTHAGVSMPTVSSTTNFCYHARGTTRQPAAVGLDGMARQRGFCSVHRTYINVLVGHVGEWHLVVQLQGGALHSGFTKDGACLFARPGLLGGGEYWRSWL
eukprot:352498-Chlamydomonas_euryale.AAC.5